MFTKRLEQRKAVQEMQEEALPRKVKDIILSIELYNEWKRKENQKLLKEFREKRRVASDKDAIQEPEEVRKDEFEFISMSLLKAYQQNEKHTNTAAKIIKEKVETAIKNINEVELLELALAL